MKFQKGHKINNGRKPWNKGTIKMITKNCEVCGNTFTRPFYKKAKLCSKKCVSIKIKSIGLAHKGVKKTEEHKQALRKSHPRLIGEKSPHWKGGKRSESERIRNTLEYHIWRNEVYRRDNWSCRICSIKCLKNTIVAHHIKLFSEFPELRFSVENGLTLCRSCHMKLHKKIK